MDTTRKGQGQPKAGAKSPGAIASTPNGKFSLISEEKLIGLYTNLLKCREVDRQLNGASNGRNGSTLGLEAALVGTSMDLGAGDLVCSLERGLLASLSAENTMEKLLVDSGYNGSNGLSNGKRAVNGAGAAGYSLAHAAIGTALANKTAKNGKIALVYSSESNSDCIRDTIHIASVHALPMVFVQHLHGDRARPRAAAQTRHKKQPGEETPWFPIITVDTHDVVAVYRVANEAISRARLGRGPTVIECQPFALNGTADKRNGLRPADPVLHMEHYLRAKGLSIPS